MYAIPVELIASPVGHAIGRLRRFHILRYTSHAAPFTETAVKFLLWCEHEVRRSKVPGMAEFADELFASDPRELCGCKFSAPESARKKKREQRQLEKRSGMRRAREDDDWSCSCVNEAQLTKHCAQPDPGYPLPPTTLCR